MISYTIKICKFDLRKNRNICKTFDEAMVILFIIKLLLNVMNSKKYSYSSSKSLFENFCVHFLKKSLAPSIFWIR